MPPMPVILTRLSVAFSSQQIGGGGGGGQALPYPASGRLIEVGRLTSAPLS